jgi:Fe-S-cluster containining protein
MSETDTMTPERAAFVQERLDAAHASGLGAALATINNRHFPSIRKRMIPILTDRALNDGTKTKLFHDAIEPLTREVSALSACRKGCSHCCHISVAINQGEAALIGRKLGIKPAKPENRALEPRDKFADAIPLGYGNPCPFLKNNECSIYDVRPLACREHFNMDVDAELCRLDMGSNGVPLYKTDELDMLGLKAVCNGNPYKVVIADIREFFPAVNS